MSKSHRIERDSMGEMTVPHDVLHGATTQRAVLNFPVSGRRVPGELIRAYAMLKRAAAEPNRELRKLDAKRASAIVNASAQILTELDRDADAFMRHFPIDVFQTGSGTSTNMNVNEVIANLAAVAAGKAIGARE